MTLLTCLSVKSVSPVEKQHCKLIVKGYAFFLRRVTLKVMFLHSWSTELFNIGKCNRAIEAALMNIGMKDSFTPLDKNDSLL